MLPVWYGQKSSWIPIHPYNKLLYYCVLYYAVQPSVVWSKVLNGVIDFPHCLDWCFLFGNVNLSNPLDIVCSIRLIPLLNFPLRKYILLQDYHKLLNSMIRVISYPQRNMLVRRLEIESFYSVMVSTHGFYIRHKIFINFPISLWVPPPWFWKGVDWRLLVESRIPNIAKLRG